jgi:hypothetical protein
MTMNPAFGQRASSMQLDSITSNDPKPLFETQHYEKKRFSNVPFVPYTQERDGLGRLNQSVQDEGPLKPYNK